MGRICSRDARDRVDEIVLEHQLHYSLMQLRLVGLLMLLFLLARGLPLLLGFDGPPIEQLASITALSNGLPLLPLGISLYLLGGGPRSSCRPPCCTALWCRWPWPACCCCPPSRCAA